MSPPDWWIRQHAATRAARATVETERIECPHEEKFSRGACRSCYARWYQKNVRRPRELEAKRRDAEIIAPHFEPSTGRFGG